MHALSGLSLDISLGFSPVNAIQLIGTMMVQYGYCIVLCVSTETLYHRDDALLYIAYVMLIWAAPIPADRWHCNL